ncbi:MAG: 4-(cytidine 5'-diphospho)-2-C-methyl-D-erythritol kinase [Candidatus Neomarinimicrobiota bacterium]|nr:MAG: 4-(cytidine 5'-diphospho)-2-C-methyl-D-erythritol kinase [Flavobacteriaceae bacterium TMED184]
MDIKSYAKINLGLHVHDKRKDGFHNLTTVFQEINLCDSIKIREAEFFSCRTNLSSIKEKENFCTIAYTLLKKKFPDIPNVEISISKNIPINAGLGGGSSNGAAVIKGINSLFNLSLTSEEMHEIASKVSSDSSFFINGGIQIGTKRGDVLKKISKISIPKHFLLVKPKIKIKTKEAFLDLKNHLLNENPHINLSRILKELKINNFNSKLFKNDFEMYVFKTHPEIGGIKLKILDLGAIYASLSGTGSTVFGIFPSKAAALKAEAFFSPRYSTYYVNPII